MIERPLTIQVETLEEEFLEGCVGRGAQPPGNRWG
jgi:hypothetical protein